MDPIKVDFSRKDGGRKTDIVVPPERAVLKTILSIVCTLVFAAVAFYVMLPAVNFKSYDFYIYLGLVAASFVVFSAVFTNALSKPEYMPYVKKQATVPLIVIALLVAVVGVGYVISCQFFRAEAYSKIITVDDSKTFAEDVEAQSAESFKVIPKLDSDSANQLATRALGDLAKINLESQFKVSAENNTQINYNGNPTRVVPLEYDTVIKWFYNTREGLPGFIKIDMASEKTEFVKLDKNIRYSTAEHFKYFLDRHLRFEYPTYMFGDATFEVTDDNSPYWVCPVLDKTIGLFGGTDVKSIILVDAITGECKEYSLEEIKTNADLQWIDRVYDSDLIVEQYNYYGKYRQGFWNSILGQKEVVTTTQGYNYIAQGDDVWMYTGVTSVTGDNSITGFVLVNQRTKETKYYSVTGGTENSAQDAAQGRVKDLGYSATFPLLLNIGGEPTYFMSLKDDSNIVQQYALINVRQYNNIGATGTDLAKCLENYLAVLEEKAGVTTDINPDDVDTTKPSEDEDTAPALTAEGVIADIRTAVKGGESYYYIKLDSNAAYFSFAAKNNESVVILNAGDSVKITYKGEGAIIAAESIEIK
ncbi:MAG: CvpA family protein [Clostridia bacterium]|nr:CvpA family protein [Clostridia bacterium]